MAILPCQQHTGALGLHCSFAHKLWSDADVAALGLRNQVRLRAWPTLLRAEADASQAAFDGASNWGEKSDIARYEILHRFGGVYVDTDYVCVRSVAPLHEVRARHEPCGPECDGSEAQAVSFYAGLSSTGCVELNNGLIGAAPGHPLLQSLITGVQADCPV